MRPISIRFPQLTPRAICCVALCTGLLVADAMAANPRRSEPTDIVIITVDTLRADHLSSYGYARRTSPNIDRLIGGGARFSAARTVEPLTNPALSSMITSTQPHAHGGSRNGIRIRSALASLPKTLQAHGYRTTAFVGNWTLRDKLSGLAEHFEQYEEVLTRKRYFGLVKGEADANDITAAGIDWLQEHRQRRGGQPFLLWLHYVDPHAPYRLHREHLSDLGLGSRGNYSKVERYDTEIAFVDRAIGEVLDKLEQLGMFDDTLIVFASDHGESLGEHGYWGHGRHLYEPSLRIPLGVHWPARIQPQSVAAPALIIDIAPTILGLLGLDPPPGFEGYDWTGVLAGEPAPMDRVTLYQAHRGAVISNHDSDALREAGLLAVAAIHRERKEILRVEKSQRALYDLATDPLELTNLTDPRDRPTEGLAEWMRVVFEGLSSFDDAPPEPLDEESIERLRALGYVD